MKIKSSKVNNKNKVLSKKYDTIYVNSDSLFCFSHDIQSTKTPYIKNVIVSKKLIENQITATFRIYNTSANNLFIEGYDNYGDITIPLDCFLKYFLTFEIFNDIVNLNFKKINITDNGVIISTIDVNEKVCQIIIHEDFDELCIQIKDNKKIINYFIDRNNEPSKRYIRYNILKDDLDKDGNLDIRDLFKYEILSSNVINVNTLIIDKNIFKNVDKVKEFEFNQKRNYKTNIKNIRIIENNDMKLIPFDKTFEIEEFLLNDTGKKYLYIKTKDDEVVIYMDKDSNLKYISKNELLKEPEIKNVYYRFRKETKCNGGVYKPLSFIIKEYKDGRIKLNNLFKEIELDDNFRQNIIFKIDKLSKLHFVYLNCIKSNDYLNLLNLPEFSDEILNKLLLINSQCEIIHYKLENSGLTDNALDYLKLRGLLEKISELKLSQIEIDTFNELGESYVKKLKK